MHVILFGATGMVGQGALRECLLDPNVKSVLCVTRTSLGDPHPKVREIIHKDFTDFTSIEAQLGGFDACFWCLGVTSAGMQEADYRRVTYEYTMAAATSVLRASPHVSFIFVSGEGTDSTEKGAVMWARVKGKAENALLKMPFKDAYVFRPGMIEPMHGITSRTMAYQVLYLMLRPILPVVRKLWPNHVTSTEAVGVAMLHVARHGWEKKILHTRDINAAARAANALKPLRLE